MPTFSAGQTLTAADLNSLGSRTLIQEVTRSTASAGFTTTETVLDYITFTAVSGATYELRCATSLQSTVAGDLIQARFRYQAAAALTTAGTEFHDALPNADIAGKGQVLSTFKTISGLAAGQTSIGITAVRSTGTGTISSFGASSQVNVLSLYRIL